MNILHVLDERWDSGLTEYGLALAIAQKARGENVAVCAPEGSFALANAAKRGVPALPFKSVVGLRRLVHRHGAQVVNAHTGRAHTAGYLATVGRPVALIRTRGDARPLARRLGQGWLYERTDAVVGVSRCISSQYQVVYPELAGRLWTVYPGMAVPDYAAETPGPVRIALVGRLDPVKGHSYFLDALNHVRAALRDEEFIIAGEEKNTPLEELKRYAERAHVSKWVRFMGRLDDVPAFMRTCHIGVIASVGSEALSRVCLEWMANGRPVVASAVGCLPELISTGENGFLVPPRSPHALANCLMGLLQQPHFRREMGRRAHAQAVERFGLARFAAETDRVYESALRRRWSRVRA